ncbi:Predicted transcriptional regulator [Amycolatopsis arida]|uniref:Predicted transcriptional regulator n=1 Tax=Amycolatopsis arida TaxID=587909 RepID=A0A1I6ALR4_9PSEU|nr:BlaI/MecI/CopY family transcriptional regulator [Amycolatopsis arida]TDX87389.1 putative transcriptional regulator [Amycolatopsis arida]SFQ69668.1 Predicted transcriptional regulator [Amycolatopsis arida]
MRRFGELEAAIMDVVWAAEERVTVREVVDALRASRSPAYTTVQTVMDILHRKGWLAREKDGRAYSYWALASREDYATRLIDDVLSETPDRAAVLARFVSEMDPAEVAELRQALGEVTAKRRRS